MHTQQGSYDQTFYVFYRITHKVYFARKIGFLAKKDFSFRKKHYCLDINLLL